MPRSRVKDGVPAGPKSLACDGTPQDYRRHSYRGEEPCPESRDAWRKSIRFYRKTGVYSDGVQDDADEQHPFMYAKPTGRRKRTRTPGKRRV